jgi:mono/diheme cytochrome c family protein
MRRFVLLLFLVACDDRQAFQTPDPTLARMLDQRRIDPYGGEPMRRPPAGSVPHDDDRDDPPPPITRALLERGRARFDVFCATCHGVDGEGRSVVATKMSSRPPPSLHEPRYRDLPRERIFTIVTDGYGLMPGYAAAVSRDDRWAVAGYVKALQTSRAARVAELPADVRATLEKEAR